MIREKSAKRRVGFFIHAPETFSAVKPLISEMLKLTDKFDVLIYSLPRNYTGRRGECVGGEIVSSFLRKQGYLSEVIGYNMIKDILTLRKAKLEFIFRQSPWDHHIPRHLGTRWFRGLRKVFGSPALCYIPYGLMTVCEPEQQYNRLFHNVCKFIFCESEFHRIEFVEYRRRGGVGVYATGYPRFQSICEEMERANAQWPLSLVGGMRKVIWAPHHTIDSNWLGLSTFVEYRDAFLEEARRGRFSILVRPHPALREKLAHRGIMSTREYDEWCESIDATGTSLVDRSHDYIPSFVASDLLITDGVGFFADYLLTAKPLVRTRRAGVRPLNKFGEWMVTACRCVDNCAELLDLFDEIAEERYRDNLREARLERQAELKRLGSGSVKQIVSLIGGE